MELGLVPIREKFDQVLAAATTREEASQWARLLRESYDRGGVTFWPAQDRRKIWNALLFLEGVDLKDGPNSYLHNETDIERERP